MTTTKKQVRYKAAPEITGPVEPIDIDRTHFRIRYWSHYQHYGDRTPGWIKLYSDFILDEYAFAVLPPSTQIFMIRLLCLASRGATSDGWLTDCRSLAHKLNTTARRVEGHISKLIRWIEPINDSKLVVQCYQNACLEGEVDREVNKDKEGEGEPPNKNGEKPAPPVSFLKDEKTFPLKGATSIDPEEAKDFTTDAIEYLNQYAYTSYSVTDQASNGHLLELFSQDVTILDIREYIDWQIDANDKEIARKGDPSCRQFLHPRIIFKPETFWDRRAAYVANPGKKRGWEKKSEWI